MEETRNIPVSDAELDSVNGGTNATRGTIRTKGTDVNVRNAPGGGDVIICIHKSGTQLKFYGFTNGWAKVGTTKGTGYIYKDYVTF